MDIVRPAGIVLCQEFPQVQLGHRNDTEEATSCDESLALVFVFFVRLLLLLLLLLYCDSCRRERGSLVSWRLERNNEVWASHEMSYPGHALLECRHRSGGKADQKLRDGFWLGLVFKSSNCPPNGLQCRLQDFGHFPPDSTSWSISITRDDLRRQMHSIMFHQSDIQSGWPLRTVKKIP